jgi:hypothetical protein
MLQVGFEPTIPASKRAKTVLALDQSATVTGTQHNGGYIRHTCMDGIQICRIVFTEM